MDALLHYPSARGRTAEEAKVMVFDECGKDGHKSSKKFSKIFSAFNSSG
jgi:hypothetical protein